MPAFQNGTHFSILFDFYKFISNELDRFVFVHICTSEFEKQSYWVIDLNNYEWEKNDISTEDRPSMMWKRFSLMFEDLAFFVFQTRFFLKCCIFSIFLYLRFVFFIFWHRHCSSVGAYFALTLFLEKISATILVPTLKLVGTCNLAFRRIHQTVNKNFSRKISFLFAAYAFCYAWNRR